MEKGTNVCLVAARAITLNPLVLVRMIQPLHCCMTLIAFESTFTVIPAHTTLQSLTVLRRILEQVRGPPEIPRMVRINAALAIMAVLLGRTPTSLVIEHIKHVALLPLVDLVQALVQVGEI